MTTHCQICGRQIKTTKNGKIAKHGLAYTSHANGCPGSGQPPREAAKIVPDNVEIGSKAHLDALSKLFGL